MEITMGSASNLVTGVIGYTFQKVRRHFSYVFHYRRRVSDFENKVVTLKERRDRVQREVDDAENKGDNIHTDVKTWLIQADALINSELKGLENKAKSKCFIGLCPNFKARYQLGEKADASAVVELVRQGEFPKVWYRNVAQGTMNVSPKDFEAFDSRKQVFSDIMEAVNDPNVNIIGVYGMAGVGKTTLVKEVVRQVKEDKLFDSVVMAAVTQTPDIQKIQDQFADMLGLKFEELSVNGRANRLCERLKKEKKILVVLDDIWATLNPTEVGIPSGDEHHGCTILLTSRDLHVLSKGMDAKKCFLIGVLGHNDAWDLFKKMAGDSIESPDLLPIATKVAKKCGGLPVAIKALAKTLRNEPPFVWEDSLRKLNKPSTNNFRGVPAEAYSAIELSYNRLESEEYKQTFLLCSLIGHNAYIAVLLKLAMGLGIFHGVDTVEETRNRLLTVVNHLKASCLLLDGYYIESVDMHDLICDVAISIASKDNRMFVSRNEDVIHDWPSAEIMKTWDIITLWNANISKLPDHLKCPKLSFFFMVSKDPPTKIPTNFFQEMRNLRVLVFCQMDFPSLPSSLSLLANLRTLCLDQCVLGDISLIGELKDLEILHFVFSDIEMLPNEIGKLTKLKLLDLSGSKLKRIESGVFNTLGRLEELYMGNSFMQWETERHVSHSQQNNASLVELRALSCLTVLDVHVPHADIIPKDFSFENLRRYNIFIGDAWDWNRDWDWVGVGKYSRTLKLNLQTRFRFLNNGIKVLLKKAESVELDEMKGVEILLHEPEARDYFQQLKNLHIQNGAMVQHILKDNGVIPKIEFPQLQSLTLEGMPNFISFCSQNNCSTSTSQQGMALFNQKILFPKLEKLKLSTIGIERICHPQAFCSAQNLTSLIIEGCSNLKHVISDSMAEYLQQLKYLEISDCKCINEIIPAEEMTKEAFRNRAPISFPLLNTLKLKGLEKLIRFCHEDYKVEFPALKILEIENCPELRGFVYESMSKDIPTEGVLFNEKVVFLNLEKIVVSHLRNVKRMWSSQLHADSFSNLKELKVEYCDALLNIFPSFLLRFFPRLETLTVSDCASLEEVFRVQVQGSGIEEASVVSSQFKVVELVRLPKLKHVWNKDPNGHISFQNLRNVYVWECWSLKNLFPFSIAKGLHQLESLTVHFCGLEEIVSKNMGVEQGIWFEFKQLSFLMLWHLPNLKCFYPGMHSTMWPMLKKLKTYECLKMKIFGQEESQIQQPMFLIQKAIPQLEEVSFSSDDIEMISGGQFEGDMFWNIKHLRITCYHFDTAVFPFSFLQRFYNVESLEVDCCDFQNLSPYEGDIIVGGQDMLPNIKKLKLFGLNNIRHLWKQASPLDHICASLESLEVFRCDNLITLSSASSSFRNLTTLDVWKCKEMVELITSSKAQSLGHLVTLKIRECQLMREIIAGEGDEATYQEIIFRELKCLELYCLQNLKNFCLAKCSFNFPSLNQVIVRQCPRLKSFCQGALSTPKLLKVQLMETDYKGRWAGDLNATMEQLYKEQVGYCGLTHLKLSEFSELINMWSARNPREMLDFKSLEFIEVCDSSQLRCIFIPSVASNLGRLQEIEIKRCANLQQVIKEEGSTSMFEEDANKMISIFPRLKSITVEHCPNMTSFYMGSTALEYPSLTDIKIAGSPNMTSFVSTFSREEVRIGDGTHIFPAFFCDKVGFPNLQKITISYLINVKRIWNNQLHADSFSKLKELNLSRCESLLNIFPPSLSRVLQSLEVLNVSDCASIEQVFQPRVEAYVVSNQLKQLELVRLPKLKHVWDVDPKRNMSFENLRKILVEDCLSLETLLPFSVGRNLKQLESLKLVSCGMKEIVSENVGEKREVLFEFNGLSYLELWNLPNLTCLYPGKHTTRWPALKRLKIYGCYYTKAFDYGDPQLQEPLFKIQKIIPQLEEVAFSSDDIAMLSNVQFATDFFRDIKVVWITHYLDETAAFPFRFIQRFHNLQILEMFSCNFKNLSFDEGENREVTSTFRTIKELKLDFFDKIQYLWNQDSPLHHMCRNLECLRVWRCESLIDISSAPLSTFQYLTILDVRICKAMAQMITSSKARSLERLVTLRIRECETMREVIASDGDEATTYHENEIVFKELQYLELHCLQNLTSFCSGNYSLKFPSLDQVIVSECPTLKHFCEGALSTPRLQKVQRSLTDHKGCWTGDLNATIQQLNIQEHTHPGDTSIRTQSF